MQEHPEGALPDKIGFKLAVVVAGLIGGYLVRSAIETPYSHPRLSLNSSDLELVAILYFSSIVFLLWAMVAVPAWRRASLRWVKRLVAVYGVCLLLTAVTQWGEVRLIFYPFCALSDLMVLLYPGAKAHPGTLRFARNATLVLSGGQVAAMLLWSWATIPFMMWNATSLAADKPYCIATRERFNFGPGAEDYRPMTALLDMQGLTMQTSQWHESIRDSQRFHAVLVIQGDAGMSWWNWSHWTASFVPINHPNGFGNLVSPGVPPGTWFSWQAETFLTPTC